MRTDSFVQAGRSVRCGMHRVLAAACPNGINDAATGVLAGDGVTADEFADSQPDRGVAR